MVKNANVSVRKRLSTLYSHQYGTVELLAASMRLSHVAEVVRLRTILPPNLRTLTSPATSQFRPPAV